VQAIADKLGMELKIEDMAFDSIIPAVSTGKIDVGAADISAKMELLIEELSNSKDGVLLEYLNKYPILSTKAHKSPFDNQWLNLLAGIIVPIGLFFYFRIWRFSIRLDKDLKNIIKTNREIQERINNKSFII
jgi:lipopolysaccharide export system permease protein